MEECDTRSSYFSSPIVVVISKHVSNATRYTKSNQIPRIFVTEIFSPELVSERFHGYFLFVSDYRSSLGRC